MSADHVSEKYTRRQLSTLFKMQSVDIDDYEGTPSNFARQLAHLSGKLKKQKENKEAGKKKDKFKKQCVPEYKPHQYNKLTVNVISPKTDKSQTVE